MEKISSKGEFKNARRKLHKGSVAQASSLQLLAIPLVVSRLLQLSMVCMEDTDWSAVSYLTTSGRETKKCHGARKLRMLTFKIKALPYR